MTGLDGTPGGLLGHSGGHPDSSSTAAVSCSANLGRISLLSEGTVGESLLTSSTNGAWSWGGLSLEESLNLAEVSGSECDGGIESGLILIECLALACNSLVGEILCGNDQCKLSGGDLLDGGIEESLLSIPESGLLDNFGSEFSEGGTGGKEFCNLCLNIVLGLCGGSPGLLLLSLILLE